MFVQIDVDKSGTISIDELKRTLKALKKVYDPSDDVIAELFKRLDTDSSGDLNEVEWCRNLDNFPALKSGLQQDLDPDTGKLRSYRSTRQQFAKLLGNIDRS